MAFINKLAQILLIIGGLNWGLVGIFNFDLVAFLFGPMTVTENIVYNNEQQKYGFSLQISLFHRTQGKASAIGTGVAVIAHNENFPFTQGNRECHPLRHIGTLRNIRFLQDKQHHLLLNQY